MYCDLFYEELPRRIILLLNDELERIWNETVVA